MCCACPPPFRVECGRRRLTAVRLSPPVLGPFEQPNHGARSAKETGQTASVLFGPGHGVPIGRALDFSRVHRTTLGNGYLGSRIDEERSEMRYLV